MTIYEFAELTGKTPEEAGTLISTKYKNYIVVGQDGIHTINDDILDLPEFSSDAESTTIPSDAVSVTALAEELHVSKQAVHQKRKRQPLADQLKPYTVTVLNKVYIYGKGLEIVRAAFAGSSTPNSSNYSNAGVNRDQPSQEPEFQRDREENVNPQNGRRLESVATDNHANPQKQRQNVNVNSFTESVNLQSKSVNSLQPILDVLTKQIDEKDRQLREKDSQIQEINANYKSVITAFQGQLEAKDNQINQLIEQNSSLSGQLSAEQALHAGTMSSQKGISDGEQIYGAVNESSKDDDYKDIPAADEIAKVETAAEENEEDGGDTEVIRTGLNDIGESEEKHDFSLDDFPRIDSDPQKSEQDIRAEERTRLEQEFRMKHPFLSKFIKSF